VTATPVIGSLLPPPGRPMGGLYTSRDGRAASASPSAPRQDLRKPLHGTGDRMSRTTPDSCPASQTGRPCECGKAKVSRQSFYRRPAPIPYDWVTAPDCPVNHGRHSGRVSVCSAPASTGMIRHSNASHSSASDSRPQGTEAAGRPDLSEQQGPCRSADLPHAAATARMVITLTRCAL
jgi:hypothetical protein